MVGLVFFSSVWIKFEDQIWRNGKYKLGIRSQHWLEDPQKKKKHWLEERGSLSVVVLLRQCGSLSTWKAHGKNLRCWIDLSQESGKHKAIGSLTFSVTDGTHLNMRWLCLITTDVRLSWGCQFELLRLDDFPINRLISFHFCPSDLDLQWFLLHNLWEREVGVGRMRCVGSILLVIVLSFSSLAVSNAAINMVSTIVLRTVFLHPFLFVKLE